MRIFPSYLNVTFLLLPGLVLSMAAGPEKLAAQDRTAEDAATFWVYPVIAFNSYSHRYEQAAGTNPGGPDAARLGPSRGPSFGLGASARIRPRLSIAASGTRASPSYRFDAPNGETIRGGDQTILRFTGGFQYRIRPQVPGYFSLGAVATRISPQSPVYAPSEGSRTEMGAYGGVGLDLGTGDWNIRIEGRLFFAAPGTTSVEGTFVSLSPRSLAFDRSISMGLVLPL